MIRNKIKLSVLLALVSLTQLPVSSSFSQRRSATQEATLTGAWMGEYECEGERHPMLLKVREDGNGVVLAEFHGLYDEDDYFSFEMRGEIKQRRGRLRVELSPGDWIMEPLEELTQVGLKAKLKAGVLKGRVLHEGCGRFKLQALSCDLSREAPCLRGQRGLFARHINRLGEVKRARKSQGRRRHQAKPAERKPAPRQAPPPERVDPVEPALRAMPKPLFEDALHQVEGEGLDQNKLKQLKLILGGASYVNLKQAHVLLAAFSFDPMRLEALQVIAPRLIAHSNVLSLLDTFTFDASKKKAKAILMGRQVSQVTPASGADQSDRTQATREEAQAETAKPTEPTQPPEPKRPVKVAMEGALFSALLTQIDDESFDKGRQSLLDVAASQSYFTCEQVKTLLSKWTFDPDRLKALQSLAPRIINPEAGFIILSEFTFDSNKSKAKQLLGLTPR